MADIIAPPNFQDQEECHEYYTVAPDDIGKVVVDIDLTWDYTLTPDEQFTSFGITNVGPDSTAYGMNIDGARYHGRYVRYFERARVIPLLLTVRDRQTLSETVVDGFGNLPGDATSCDVIEFQPPAEQQQVFTITVRLDWIDVSVPATPVPMFMERQYQQTLFGSYASWGEQLSSYIEQSGPFPRVE